MSDAVGTASTEDPMALVFRAIRSGNAFEETVQRLLQAVRLGLVAPGQRLPAERDLAVRLGVSRATLREALRSLQDDGWLQSRRGRHGGTFVLDRTSAAPERRTGQPLPTSAELEDVLVLRSVLELGAVERAAGAAPTAAQAVRQRLAELLAESLDAPLERYRAADSRLHLGLAELSGSPSLARAVADVRLRVNDLLDAIPLLQRNIVHSNDQHEEVVRAVLAGRPDTARLAMAGHLSGSAALLRGFLG